MVPGLGMGGLGQHPDSYSGHRAVARGVFCRDQDRVTSRGDPLSLSVLSVPTCLDAAACQEVPSDKGSNDAIALHDLRLNAGCARHEKTDTKVVVTVPTQSTACLQVQDLKLRGSAATDNLRVRDGSAAALDVGVRLGRSGERGSGADVNGLHERDGPGDRAADLGCAPERLPTRELRALAVSLVVAHKTPRSRTV